MHGRSPGQAQFSIPRKAPAVAIAAMVIGTLYAEIAEQAGYRAITALDEEAFDKTKISDLMPRKGSQKCELPNVPS